MVALLILLALSHQEKGIGRAAVVDEVLGRECGGGALSNRTFVRRRYLSKVEDACVALIEDELFYYQRLACITKEKVEKSCSISVFSCED